MGRLRRQGYGGEWDAARRQQNGWTFLYNEVEVIGSRACERMWTLLGTVKQPMNCGNVQWPGEDIRLLAVEHAWLIDGPHMYSWSVKGFPGIWWSKVYACGRVVQT